MPRDPEESKQQFEELSWRTRELGPELRRKLFEKLVPQSGPRVKPVAGPEPKRSEPKRSRRPEVRRDGKDQQL